MATNGKQQAADCGNEPGGGGNHHQETKPMAAVGGHRTCSPTPSLHPPTNTQESATTGVNSSSTSSASNSNIKQASRGRSTSSVSIKHQDQRKISSANLLSPNNAYDQSGLGGGPNRTGLEPQRRRSTLSANGFFIDYSCTRRRSYAASHQQQARAKSTTDPLVKGQFLRSVISPVRRPSTMIAGSMSGGGRESFSALSGRTQSRASCSLATPSHHQQLLQPPGGHHRLRAPSVGGGIGIGAGGGAFRSLAGSRKTSIFDPTGHSLAAARRRSTMTMGSAGLGGPAGASSGGGCTSPLAPAIEQAATMLAVSRHAAALQRAEQLGGKRELVERVPVIGCSPTSIRASLAALDETRRYKKLLHKLKKHQRRKEKERIRLIDDDDNELMCDINLDADEEDDGDYTSDDYDSMAAAADCDKRRRSTRFGGGGTGADNDDDGLDSGARMGANFRRRSLRAIKDVGLLLNKAAVMQKRRRRRKRRWRMSSASCHRGDSFVDGLSISSTLSFVSSQTSTPSIDRFLNELSLFQYGTDDRRAGDDDGRDEDDDEEDDGEDESNEDIRYHRPDEAASSCYSDGNSFHGPDQVCDDDGDDRADNEVRGSRRTGQISARRQRAHSCQPGSSRATATTASTSNGGPNQRNDRLWAARGQRTGKNNNEQTTPTTSERPAGQRIGAADGGGERKEDESRDGNDEERQGKQQQKQQQQLQQQQQQQHQASDSVMSRGRAKGATNISGGGSSNNNNNNNSSSSNNNNAPSSLVRKAMKRIVATLGAKRSPSSGNLDELEMRSRAERFGGRRETTTGVGGGSTGAAGREFGETKARLNKQQLDEDEEECHTETTEAQAQAQAQAQSRGRRRSVSMSAGLNYWHYYYYLRNNSLDQQEGGLELPLMLAASSRATGSTIGCGGLGGGTGAAEQQAACAAAASAGVVGGGTPMSDFDRRARLYINYSLARLEILNCQSDPVAQLAERLAKAEAKQAMLAARQQQQMQTDWGPGVETTGTAMGACGPSAAAGAGPDHQQQQQQQQQPQSPVWDRLFDFSDTTDVSLTLSTSSSCAASTDGVSRTGSSLSSGSASGSSSSNSGSISSTGSSCSSSALDFVESAPSYGRAPPSPMSLDDRYQRQHQHLAASAVAADGTNKPRPDARMFARADDQNVAAGQTAVMAAAAASSASQASLTGPSIGQPADVREIHAQTHHQQHYQHQSQQPSHSHSSYSIHSTPGQQGQPEGGLDYVCKQRHSSCFMSQQQQHQTVPTTTSATAAHIPYANLIPGQDLNQQQQSRRAHNSSPGAAGTASVVGLATVSSTISDCQPNSNNMEMTCDEGLRVRQMRSRSISRSVGCMGPQQQQHHQQPALDRGPLACSHAAATTSGVVSCQVAGACELAAHDSVVVVGEQQQDPSWRLRPFQRDAHFRFSVKAPSKSKQLNDDDSNGATRRQERSAGGYRSHRYASEAATEDANEDHHYRHKQVGPPSKQYLGSQLGTVSRYSRATQSWDRLEIVTDQLDQQQQQQQLKQQQQQQQHSLSSSASQSRSTLSPSQVAPTTAAPATAGTPSRAALDRFERTEEAGQAAEATIRASRSSGGGGSCGISGSGGGGGSKGAGISGGGRLGSAETSRSFRMPKAASSGGGGGSSARPLAASKGTSGGWASRSRSFLFQGRLSFRSKHSNNNKQTSGPNDEPQALARDHGGGGGNESKDNGDDYARCRTATTRRSIGRRPSPAGAGVTNRAPRDEQREAADKLLEQFEAQMSQAASLGREAELNSARSHQQQQQQREERNARRDYHQHHEFQGGFYEAQQSGSGASGNHNNNNNNHSQQQRQLSPCRYAPGTLSRSSASSTQSIDSSHSHNSVSHHRPNHRRGDRRNKQVVSGSRVCTGQRTDQQPQQQHQQQRQASNDASLAASVALSGASESLSQTPTAVAAATTTSTTPTQSATLPATGHYEQVQLQTGSGAGDCYHRCQPGQLQRPSQNDNRHHSQQQLSSQQQFGGSQLSFHNQLYPADSLSLADGSGGPLAGAPHVQPHLDSIQSAAAANHYLGAPSDEQAMSRSWQHHQQHHHQQATQVRQDHNQAASQHRHHHHQQQQQQQHHQQQQQPQQHDDNNNSNFSRNTTNESSFDSCIGSMPQQHQQHQSSSSNEDAINQTPMAYEFNYAQQQQQQQQQAAHGQMNQMPPADYCRASLREDLAPRARAHSTSAGVGRYAGYGSGGCSINLQSQQQQQQQQQHQLGSHTNNNQLHPQMGGMGQTNASSMVALSSLAHQTARDVRLASVRPDGASLQLQLSPRLLASDSAGCFMAHHNNNQQQQRLHNQDQQNQRELRGRGCLSARPSSAFLAKSASGTEIRGPGRGELSTAPGLKLTAAAGSSPAHSLRHLPSSAGNGNEPLAGDRRRSGAVHLGASSELHGSDRRASSASRRRRSSATRPTNQESRRSTLARDQFTDGTTPGAGADLNAQALGLLRKNSFGCTILGARQTGKRTIVICFIKLLNEFKLAADEYKKERMLTKLVECSEKLQELANKQEAEEEEEEENQRRQRSRRTSRLNSWLPSSGMVKNLLSSSSSPITSARQKRAHSTVAATGPHHHQQQQQQQQQQRQQQQAHQVNVEPRKKSDAAPAAATVIGASKPAPIRMSRRRLRIMLSLKELNRRKFAIKFNTRRHISASLIEQMREAEKVRLANSGRAGRRKSTIIQLSGCGANGHSAPMPDAFLVVYSINDRDSFDYARSMIEQLRSMSELLQQDVPVPIMLVANKSDLERNREVKIDDGRAVAKKYSCKFIEISCTIGFNLDNLLVGLRTQLVLKHHVVLNSILRPDFRRHAALQVTKDDDKNRDGTKRSKDKRPSNENFLTRFYKRYLMDNHKEEYDCDIFSKL